MSSLLSSSVQLPQRYFRSNAERMQAFLTAINMFSPRVRVASVSVERKSLPNSKLEERQRTKINNCAESLISVDHQQQVKINFLSCLSLLEESFNC